MSFRKRKADGASCPVTNTVEDASVQFIELNIQTLWVWIRTLYECTKDKSTVMQWHPITGCTFSSLDAAHVCAATISVSPTWFRRFHVETPRSVVFKPRVMLVELTGLMASMPDSAVILCLTSTALYVQNQDTSRRYDVPLEAESSADPILLQQPSSATHVCCRVQTTDWCNSAKKLGQESLSQHIDSLQIETVTDSVSISRFVDSSYVVASHQIQTKDAPASVADTKTIVHVNAHRFIEQMISSTYMMHLFAPVLDLCIQKESPVDLMWTSHSNDPPNAVHTATNHMVHDMTYRTLDEIHVSLGVPFPNTLTLIITDYLFAGLPSTAIVHLSMAQLAI